MAKPLTRQAARTMGALQVYLTPKLAQDAKVALSPLLAGVTGKTWKADKPKIKVALDAAVKGKLAKDADLEDVIELLDTLDDVADEVAEVVAGEGAADPVAKDEGELPAKVMEFLTGKLSAEDLAALKAMLAPSADPASPAAQDDGKGKPAPITKAAMDAAITLAADAAAKSAQDATIARLSAARQAERDVQPFLGALDAAPDTAAAIYKLALDAQGVDLTGLPPEAYGAVLRALPKPGEAKPQASKVAMDATTTAAFDKRFPNANRLAR